MAGKKLAPVKGQKSIASFFAPAKKEATKATSSSSSSSSTAATAANASVSSKNSKLFTLGKTSKVLKKIKDGRPIRVANDDDDEDDDRAADDDGSGSERMTYQKPVFVSGYVKDFHAAAASAAGVGGVGGEDKWSVQWDTTATTSNPAVGSPNSVTSSSSDSSSSSSSDSSSSNVTLETDRNTESQIRLFKDYYMWIGTKVCKVFGTGDNVEDYYDGEVVDMVEIENDDDGRSSPTMGYTVLYEDGDFEDYSQQDFMELRKLTSANKKKKQQLLIKSQKKSKSNKRPAPSVSSSSAKTTNESSSKRKRKKVNYNDADIGDDDDDSDDEMEFEVDLDDSMDEDVLVDVEDEDDDEEVVRPSSKAKSKPKPKSKPKSKSSMGDGEIWDEFYERLEKDKKAFKQPNNPQPLPSEDFVDPVGVDPTNGIVERIMSEMVSKVGRLLLSPLSRSQGISDVGKLSYPIKLSTACSGTDAPSIALSLIEECINKMAPENNFSYDHLMSCEIEPFKQGYLGRNFPGALLFPDITRLSETDDEGVPEQVEDVYGRRHNIPPSCMFIAGTSCKDFSMLKTRDRLDIEDKGQSGETFLAAVEYLDLHKPPFAIFENVDNAPWAKMQEYLTGRVDLTFRNNDKDITTKNTKTSKKNADQDLKFKVNANGLYEVEAVPPQMGIRAGSILEGVARFHQPAQVRPIAAKEKERPGTVINLGQLAKNHRITLGKNSKKEVVEQGDILVFKKKVKHCTRLVKLDTKEYGLPQTRNRKYLFIWQSDDPMDDLGDYFCEIMLHLKTDPLYSMESFLLPPTHDRIRCFREALRSGPGLLVARDRAREPDFWDWELSRVKDLTKHKAVRENIGLPDRMRWLTEWAPRGEKKLAPGIFPELADCWNHRRLDMIDCFSGAAIRDAISRDPCHSCFIWDLSQNVDRAPFRNSTAGISGCVTPGGELFMPFLGRTVMGYEKLLLQGIPFSRLVLGKETEVQLSDLAGNAMSVPVVGATILAAICSPYLREQRREAKNNIPLSRFEINVQCDKGAVTAERGDLYKSDRQNEPQGLEDVIRDLADDYAANAYQCSVLCTSESSGTCTQDSTFLECKSCGWQVSHSAADRYQVDSHDLAESLMFKETERPDPHLFERKLRNAAPSILRLAEGSEGVLANGSGLESYSFQLQQVDRKAGKWTLKYGAWEDFGKGRQVAEIRLDVGRLSTLSDLGAAAFIKCFAPAIGDNPERGNLTDSARIVYRIGQESGPVWETPEKPVKCTLTIKEDGERVPSLRKMIGLDDDVARVLRNHKCTRQFTPPFADSTRNPWKDYPRMWQVWPGAIVVSEDPSCLVNGRYTKMSCKHTVHLSCLYRREGTKSPMYLIFRPNVMRTGLDVAVFSPSPSYKDGVEVCELCDWIPENTFDARTQRTKARLLAWTETAALGVEIPKPVMNVETEESSVYEKQVLNYDSNGPVEPVLCRVTQVPEEVASSLLEYTASSTDGNGSAEIVELDLTGKFGTRNAKRLSIVAGPTLLKFAAIGYLPVQFGQFYPLPANIPDLGRLELYCPTAPAPQWRVRNGADSKRKFYRHYDPEESNEYFHKLLARPSAFNVRVNRSKRSVHVHMNPYALAHRAAAILGGEDGADVAVEYSLNELSSMGEPIARPFQVPNSDSYEPTFVKLLFPLYTRQAKALTRMMSIENGSVMFKEEERAEENLPGVGWCAIARAFKESPLRGGVLGDAIGSGKTVITIALICAKISEARSSRNIKLGRSSATLIVVPPGLVSQWKDEVKKFTGSQLKVIIIDSVKTLKQTSVKAICCADVVICPAGIIEEEKGKKRPYTEQLSLKAKSDEIPAAPSAVGLRECPTIEGSWVRNMASGPGIYVGNKSTQQDRDNMAYYSDAYASAIEKIRSKSFKSEEKGVPLEWFQWFRVVIDEAHEVLVTGKGFKKDDFKDVARRGAREFLGVAQTDPKKRPLRAVVGVWGLTGTPLLETEARVTELANLMGGTYVTGAAHHWRREERDSGRDMFLSQTESVFSREYRCAVQSAAHKYVHEACQRNRGEVLSVQLNREQISVNMSAKEGETFIKKATRELELEDYGLNVDHLGEKSESFLEMTAASTSRQKALVGAVGSILVNDPSAKIVVFATTAGYESACSALQSSEFDFCKVSNTRDSVERQNEIISWFRHLDVNDEERQRPRILVLDFVQAAGHNLQAAIADVIFYDPVYTSPDAVADVSTEEQAVGRVYRQGQIRDVTCTRIVVNGPNGEKCLDDWIVARNTSPSNIQAATSNF